MRRFITPTIQISMGLLSLTLSLIFIAFAFGLIPSEEKAALETRAKISENLAVQIANLAGRNDVAGIKDTIASIVERNGDVLSVAIRGPDGSIMVGSDAHDIFWHQAADGKSTSTHVQIPLSNGDVPHGRIEISFRPLVSSNNILGLSEAMIWFIGFICVAGFGGYYFILKRALRELDPSGAIPERVKVAFDTLAEGVLIVDEREFIILANDAFVKNIFATSSTLLGVNVGELPWTMPENARLPDLPWRRAMRDEQAVLGVSMSIRNQAGELQSLIVNATRIIDGKGQARGVIVTFNDVTMLHRTNEQLKVSIDQLHNSQATISEQNQKLQVLASSDPLTGCLNRRSFFVEADRALQNARSMHLPLSFLMVDADHFKGINDRFGHIVGDKVLVGLTQILKQICDGRGFVGRYGGEEFCIVVSGLLEKDVAQLAEYIRLTVNDVTTWLPGNERVTISIGIASLSAPHCDIAELVKRADEALYAAKSTGRNRFVNWSDMPQIDHLSSDDQVNSRSSSRAAPRAKPVVNETGADRFKSLLDRNSILDRINAIVRADRGESRFALAHINLDNFRYFNECYGRSAGDALLTKISQRIMMRLRSTDMLVRLEGDEFLLLIDPFDSTEGVVQMLKRVIDELKYPFLIEDFQLFSSFSMGVSIYPRDGRSFGVLQRNAEVAMLHTKGNTKERLCFFDASMDKVGVSRMEAEQRLRLAIRDGKFCCAFQPKVDISNHKIVGFEALVRWRDDNGEIHPPGEFIDLAIELGLIGQITNSVLEIASESMPDLDAVFGSHTTLSINIAAVLASDVEFMLPFTQTLRNSRYANRIILEFTEESFISKGVFHDKIIPILHDIGVRVSIDDFGVGYSSLSALADIAADELKIDRSLISGIHERPRNQNILRAVISLARSLNITVVAEGVETYEELAYLHAATSIRCVQGFYFSKPFYLNDMSSVRRYFEENVSSGQSRQLPVDDDRSSTAAFGRGMRA